MHVHRSFLTAALFGALALATGSAAAQDVASAEALFNQGLADMEAGNFDTGCPALLESYRLDPRAGTLFTAAECLVGQGKIASAVARYQDYLDLFTTLTPEQQAKQGDRPQLAAEARARLKAAVPHLTLRLPPDAPPDAVVKRDDTVLARPSLGIALPLDPGEYKVTTQAPGSQVTTVTIRITEGQQLEVTLQIAPPDEDAPAGDGAVTGPVPAPETGDDGSAQRIAAFVLGGVGAAGIVAGAISGGIALSNKSTAADNCDLDAKICRNADGTDAVEGAQAAGMVSTIAFIAGGLALAGGVVLYLTAPSGPEHEAAMLRLGPSSATLVLRF